MCVLMMIGLLPGLLLGVSSIILSVKTMLLILYSVVLKVQCASESSRGLVKP